MTCNELHLRLLDNSWYARAFMLILRKVSCGVNLADFVAEPIIPSVSFKCFDRQRFKYP